MYVPALPPPLVATFTEKLRLSVKVKVRPYVGIPITIFSLGAPVVWNSNLCYETDFWTVFLKSGSIRTHFDPKTGSMTDT